MHSLRIISITLATGLAACNSATRPADGGERIIDAADAARPVDTGEPTDAGKLVDAGELADSGEPTDAEPLDIDDEINGEGPPCDTAADCPMGWKCLFWRQARTMGVCEPRCPGIDGGYFPFGVCGCDGQRRPFACTDYPWSHQGLSDEEKDAGIGADGGVWTNTACVPGPICDRDN